MQFLKQYETLSERFFGKINFQTLKFLMFTVEFSREGTTSYLSPEKIIRKYLLWQSRETPKDRIITKGNYLFDHENDLSWNDCLGANKNYLFWNNSKYDEFSDILEIRFSDMKEDPVAEALITLEKIHE